MNHQPNYNTDKWFPFFLNVFALRQWITSHTIYYQSDSFTGREHFSVNFWMYAQLKFTRYKFLNLMFLKFDFF